MLRKIFLIGCSLLFAGCMAHLSLDRFEPVAPAELRRGNKTFRVYLAPTSEGTPHRNFAERTSAALYFRHRESGPYYLKVFVCTDGIENGTQVSLVAATLLLSDGQTVELLAKGAPAPVTVTQQNARPDLTPENSSMGLLRLKIPESIVFKPGEILRVNLTLQIAGEPTEFPLAVEFRHIKSEQWMPTPLIM